jgi:hypothetical protein
MSEKAFEISKQVGLKMAEIFKLGTLVSQRCALLAL